MISVLLFFCALTISLLPWMWRNEIVWGRPLPLAHTSGANLYIGNNPNATGHWIDPPEKPPPGIRPGSPEASRWYTDQGIRFIKAHPKCFFVNGFKKIAWVLFPSFHRDDMLNIYDAPARLLTGISLLSGGMSALFILCGLTGFILKKPDRFWWLSVSIIIYHLATSFVAVGHPRFRDPVDHIFIYYASSLLVNWRCIWSDIKSGSVVVRRKIRLLTLTFIFIVVNWTIVILAKVGGPPK